MSTSQPDESAEGQEAEILEVIIEIEEGATVEGEKTALDMLLYAVGRYGDPKGLVLGGVPVSRR